jgi:uncharacterized membrane protein YeiH
VCSFAGGWVLVLAHALAAPNWLALLACSATATLLRVLALHTGYRLPAWQPGERRRD